MQLLQSDRYTGLVCTHCYCSIKPFPNQTIHIQSTAIAKDIDCSSNRFRVSSLERHEAKKSFANFKTSQSARSLSDISHTDTNFLFHEGIYCLINHDTPKQQSVAVMNYWLTNYVVIDHGEFIVNFWWQVYTVHFWERFGDGILAPDYAFSWTPGG